MKKRIFKLSLQAIVAFFVLGSTSVFSQNAPKGDDFEELLANWKTMGKDLKAKLGLSDNDFKLFKGFYGLKNDSMKHEFAKRIHDGRVTAANIKGYVAFMESEEIYMYKQFVQIKKDYPSSVSEYTISNKQRKPFATCNA